MAWVRDPRTGVARWDGEPFPEPHVDALTAYGYEYGRPPRRFLTHAAAAAYAAQRATRTGVRQRVQTVMTGKGTVWVVLPVAEPVGRRA